MTRKGSCSGLVVIASILTMTGCAPTVQLQQVQLQEPTPTEGAVVASVLVKGGRDVLGRTKYELAIAAANKGNSTTSQYLVQANRDGDEEVFVAVMPAGDYRFYEIRQAGFSNWTRATNVHFRVEPGKVTYIGRLVVDFPDQLISVYTPIRIRVEDARAPTLDRAKGRYGKDFAQASTNLMAVVSTSSLPGKSTADSALEKDTLFMIMGMDRVEDTQCGQRAIAGREILSSDPKGAVEHWTINRCGKLVRYRITYAPRADGGTTIGYTPGEVVGKTP